MDNKIKKYNDTNYNSSPVRFVDYISNKYNNIHKMLYNNALSLYLDSKNRNTDEYKQSHKFIEIKQNEYWKPSKVIIKNIKEPFETEKVDLSRWWNDYQFKDEYKDLLDILIDEDSKIDAEVIYLDYVNGKAKMRSKFTGKIFWVDFSYISEDTNYSKDEMSLANTFSYKIRNKIYGV